MLRIAAQLVLLPSDGAALAWAAQEFGRVGYAADAPADQTARRQAASVARLARAGYVVAAHMANQEATKVNRAYAGSNWSTSAEALLTIVTQPVSHASYPTAVRADGEARPDNHDHNHTHSVDLESATGSLLEVIRRYSIAKQGVGKLIQMKPIHYHLVAQGFRDSIASQASEAQICALGLPAQALAKVNVASRFMAMPSSRGAAKDGS